MHFELHPNLASKTHIIDLELCKVLLEDEVNYPWIILVPQRPNISRMMELSQNDQIQLMREIDLSQKILWKLFNPKQLNVAAIGNKTPQLHIHIIARQAEDPAWPHTVWDHPVKTRYAPKEKENVLHSLKQTFLISKN